MRALFLHLCPRNNAGVTFLASFYSTDGSLWAVVLPPLFLKSSGSVWEQPARRSRKEKAGGSYFFPLASLLSFAGMFWKNATGEPSLRFILECFGKMQQ